MPFPPTWPVFIPKDKLATWFESYAESMELNVWTGTELVRGDHDEAAGRWTLTLRRDGRERTVQARHLVYATGVSSIPVMPELPGLSGFGGTTMHSGAYTEGAAWRGRRALVLGTGNSGHDVAQDLHASGAAVTLIQRSPTYIVSLREAQSVYAVYNEGIPTEDADLLATATPYPVMVRAYQLSTAASRAADQPLLDRLAARGFRLDFGEDDTGFQMKYLRRGGGYYFNVGCSDLVADGSIGLLHDADIERFVPEGVQLRDGRVTPADLLVLATGYKSQQDVVRASLGNAVADRIGPVWGFDAGGELRNMWRPTPQPGLWFTAGSLAQCRIYSKYLALQIQARLDGTPMSGRWAIGLMTGTAIDGMIDISALRTDGERVDEFGPWTLAPYPDATRALLAETLRQALAWQFAGPEPAIFAQAEEVLTRAQSAAVAGFVAEHGLHADVIGFHGQTVLHRAAAAGADRRHAAARRRRTHGAADRH